MSTFFKKPAKIALSAFGFALVGGTLFAPAAYATTAAPSYSFTMANSLVDSVGGATLTALPTCASPDLEDVCNDTGVFGTDENGNYFAWTSAQGNGGGLTLTTPSPLGEVYTFKMKFAMDIRSTDISGADQNYSKIIDFQNRTDDEGLYYFGLDSYQFSSGFLGTGTIEHAIQQVVTVAISRNAEGTVTVWEETPSGYVQVFQAEDSAGQFIAADSGSGSIIGLFFDDGLDGSEEGMKAGRLYGFDSWPGVALSEEDLNGTLADPTSVEAPTLASTGTDGSIAGTLAILGLGMTSAGIYFLTRRIKA
jgi:hypothetical protein